MARSKPSNSELDVSRPGALAGLYLRVATALQRSPGLAEQHAARVSGRGQDQLARVELERAKHAGGTPPAAATWASERSNGGPPVRSAAEDPLRSGTTWRR